MYSVDGDHFPLELLNDDEANDLLRTLQARADTEPETPALARQIADVSDWLGYLADEASEDRAADAAAEHAAGIYADHLAGIA
ncbi:hypothetical protein HG717_33960 [Rhodococcus erythropolis]|nr:MULTISPECIES: hypothetical protein [Mycobacteriales]MBY6388875.1 hypothetical protein [Rhodococcus erythropolis]